MTFLENTADPAFGNLLVDLNQDVEVSCCMVCKYILRVLKIILTFPNEINSGLF